MKIIVVGSFRYRIYAPAIYHGLASLGHIVLKHDYEVYLYSGNHIFANLIYKFQVKYHVGLHIHNYNIDLISLVKKERPDFVFLYRCSMIYPKTVRCINKITKVFSYHNDDPFHMLPNKRYNKFYRESLEYCNINYVYRKKNLDDLQRIGIHNGKILLPYYLEKYNFYIDCAKDIPIAFIGHWEDDGREDIVKELNNANIGFQLYGPEDSWCLSKYWSEFSNIFKGEVRLTAYNELLNRTKVCLVFLSKLNHDTYTRRCFEIPATKGVMLCEYTDDMNQMFPEGECAFYFRNIEEALYKARYLLKHPEICLEIGENAYKKLLELGGSEVDRSREIITDYENLYNTNI